MKTRTEDEIMALILGFAEIDDCIRVVLMNGSRVNPSAAQDPFRDFDIAAFVTDVEPFRDEEYVVPRFGEVIVVEQPLMGPWPPAEADGRHYNYNIQLLDGHRIDLSFHHLDTLGDHLADSLTAVLIDKDSRLPALPPPNETSYLITQPTKELYDGCCAAFFFALGSHIPKTLWRRQLPLVKYYIEGWLREPMTMMLGWEIGIRTGWEKSLGFKGKHLESLLTPELWNEYKMTYVDCDYDSLWESMFLFLAIFERSAQLVAETFGFHFPKETAAKVTSYLEHVRTLPANAKQIY